MDKREAIARVEDHMRVHGITPYGQHMRLYDALQMLLSIAEDSPVTKLDTYQYQALSASIQISSFTRHLPVNAIGSLDDLDRKHMERVLWDALEHSSALEVTIDVEHMRATATLLVGIRR